ncbi:hypothetical protein HKW98_16010 [Stutzerimonas urumqiensis]|uniref:hypothetical protein n=1 Tax=Stutzerimonas urumqiensis TaxID=638269 RepID=UPI003BACBE34
MTVPEAVQAAVLLIGALLALGRVARHWRAAGEQEQPALFCALIGFALAAAFAAVSGVASLSSADLDAAEGWLARATYQLGIPLAALAVLAFARDWRWSRPTWGRLVLGLCVLFEVARQLGLGPAYALAVPLASAALMLYAAWVRPDAGTARLSGVVAGILLLISAPFPGNPLANASVLLLGLACLPLALQLTRLEPSGGADEKSANQGL